MWLHHWLKLVADLSKEDKLEKALIGVELDEARGHLRTKMDNLGRLISRLAWTRGEKKNLPLRASNILLQTPAKMSLLSCKTSLMNSISGEERSSSVPFSIRPAFIQVMILY